MCPHGRPKGTCAPSGGVGPHQLCLKQEPNREGVLMTSLFALWLPILLSAVIVFVASSIIHMVLPWHKSDYPKMPNEDQVRDALRPLAIPPGDYFVPRADDMKDMKTPEFCEKLNQGPVMMLTMMPNGPFSMGRNLGLWFLYCIATGLFAALAAAGALPVGAPYARVFHLVALCTFMGYTLGLWQMSIWYRRAWNITVKSTIDGLIYALLTAATFAWLWPR